jgi:hypothetical protein
MIGFGLQASTLPPPSIAISSLTRSQPLPSFHDGIDRPAVAPVSASLASRPSSNPLSPSRPTSMAAMTAALVDALHVPSPPTPTRSSHTGATPTKLVANGLDVASLAQENVHDGVVTSLVAGSHRPATSRRKASSPTHQRHSATVVPATYTHIRLRPLPTVSDTVALARSRSTSVERSRSRSNSSRDARNSAASLQRHALRRSQDPSTAPLLAFQTANFRDVPQLQERPHFAAEPSPLTTSSPDSRAHPRVRSTPVPTAKSSRKVRTDSSPLRGHSSHPARTPTLPRCHHSTAGPLSPSPARSPAQSRSRSRSSSRTPRQAPALAIPPTPVDLADCAATPTVHCANLDQPMQSDKSTSRRPR